MTRARLRRGVRKRREAREARDRKARRVWAASLPPPPLEGPEPCTHTWGDPVTVSFSCDSRDVIRVCAACQGFVRRCKRCRRFHLVYQGQGGDGQVHVLAVAGDPGVEGHWREIKSLCHWSVFLVSSCSVVRRERSRSSRSRLRHSRSSM